jgi:hypothetical protein
MQHNGDGYCDDDKKDVGNSEDNVDDKNNNNNDNSGNGEENKNINKNIALL